MFKTYYSLTKPGIIYGNILTAAAGFLLASRWHIDFSLLFGLIVGTSLVIGSACVFNNVIDRGIDIKMARTKKRALVSGAVTPRSALVYATVLGLIGFTTLIALTNWLTVVVGIVAFVDYVVLYGLSKRRSVYGTIVGSISGAAPIVAGYTAVTDRFDRAALLLFLILVFWQMPHFYAIAMYRLKDYTAANIPVLPRVSGMKNTKIQIMAYIVAFAAACTLLTVFGYTGVIFLIVMLVISAAWLWQGYAGFTTREDTAWARKMFFYSLIVMVTLSVMLSVGSVLV
jgi:protoheme IX farnesyltransferase